MMERECMVKKFEVTMEKDMKKEYEKFFKNRLALVLVSQEIEQKTLEVMKKDLLKQDNSISADDLSDITSIKLISLMEDKEIITMNNFEYLESIFLRMDQSDLIKKLPGKCKYFFSCHSLK